MSSWRRGAEAEPCQFGRERAGRGPRAEHVRDARIGPAEPLHARGEIRQQPVEHHHHRKRRIAVFGLDVRRIAEQELPAGLREIGDRRQQRFEQAPIVGHVGRAAHRAQIDEAAVDDRVLRVDAMADAHALDARGQKAQREQAREQLEPAVDRRGRIGQRGQPREPAVFRPRGEQLRQVRDAMRDARIVIGERAQAIGRDALDGAPRAAREQRREPREMRVRRRVGPTDRDERQRHARDAAEAREMRALHGGGGLHVVERLVDRHRERNLLFVQREMFERGKQRAAAAGKLDPVRAQHPQMRLDVGREDLAALDREHAVRAPQVERAQVPVRAHGGRLVERRDPAGRRHARAQRGERIGERGARGDELGRGVGGIPEDRGRRVARDDRAVVARRAAVDVDVALDIALLDIALPDAVLRAALHAARDIARAFAEDVVHRVPPCALASRRNRSSPARRRL
ncbi:hypothetical protein BURPS1710b_A0185 [Burkholderia pseudomallei 1710b]|uniref:Uncharacterized protein n=1 Tax=Burkholderia pseudomallei (strain 1710b) TaxID=320372 RepID=Q3JM59_BURP1|nr:hypothetical protein BURPS1710b_A0185 [Burkholderia pseudomallei 1710b]